MNVIRYLKSSFKCDLVCLGGALATAVVQIVHVAMYAAIGEPRSLLIISFLGAVFALFALFVWRARLPALWAGAAAACVVLHMCSNIASSLADLTYAVQGAVAVLCCFGGLILQIRERARPRLAPATLVALLSAAAIGLSVWLGSVAAANGAAGRAQPALWAVPDAYDAVACPEPGRVEELTYETKAYATDGRALTKRALVYLPYGYTEAERYDILYLLHGTGDGETYWLADNPQNKTLLDNLIYHGDVSPLIVVTPTWYEGDDYTWDASVCDPLIESFNEEFRSDLLPAVEGKYSTYAADLTAEGIAASRAHRAFAGLSRGAAATYRSALCGSLDYVGWFGAFSGCGTDAAYWQAHAASAALGEYPIYYLYNTSGTFDFALRGHVRDFNDILAAEPRLVLGKNCSFDVFPMRYHSMGSWHLALYHFLQKIFH